MGERSANHRQFNRQVVATTIANTHAMRLITNSMHDADEVPMRFELTAPGATKRVLKIHLVKLPLQGRGLTELSEPSGSSL